MDMLVKPSNTIAWSNGIVHHVTLKAGHSLNGTTTLRQQSTLKASLNTIASFVTTKQSWLTLSDNTNEQRNIFRNRKFVYRPLIHHPIVKAKLSFTIGSYLFFILQNNNYFLGRRRVVGNSTFSVVSNGLRLGLRAGAGALMSFLVLLFS